MLSARALQRTLPERYTLSAGPLTSISTSFSVPLRFLSLRFHRLQLRKLGLETIQTQWLGDESRCLTTRPEFERDLKERHTRGSKSARSLQYAAWLDVPKKIRGQGGQQQRDLSRTSTRAETSPRMLPVRSFPGSPTVCSSASDLRRGSRGMLGVRSPRSTRECLAGRKAAPHLRMSHPGSHAGRCHQ